MKICLLSSRRKGQMRIGRLARPYRTEHVPIEISAWLLRTLIHVLSRYGQCCCWTICSQFSSVLAVDIPNSSTIWLITKSRNVLQLDEYTLERCQFQRIADQVAKQPAWLFPCHRKDPEQHRPGGMTRELESGTGLVDTGRSELFFSGCLLG